MDFKDVCSALGANNKHKCQSIIQQLSSWMLLLSDKNLLLHRISETKVPKHKCTINNNNNNNNILYIQQHNIKQQLYFHK